MEKVDKPVKRGPSRPNGGKEPEVADLVVPVDPPENDLDLNDKEKLWVEKMNQLNTERSREDKTKTEQCQDDSADSPEFSPIVYWKEPFPEVLPLEIEEKPEKVPADSAPSSGCSCGVCLLFCCCVLMLVDACSMHSVSF